MSVETGVPMETLFSGNDLDGEEAALCDAAYSRICDALHVKNPKLLKTAKNSKAD